MTMIGVNTMTVIADKHHDDDWRKHDDCDCVSIMTMIVVNTMIDCLSIMTMIGVSIKTVIAISIMTVTGINTILEKNFHCAKNDEW